MVSLGIDELADRGFQPLHAATVGVVTNHTGRNRHGVPTTEVLLKSGKVKITALFSPEHGLHGTAAAGEVIASATDAKTGLPIHSLYGDTKRPTAAMLDGLDGLVFDMQDVGARFYTYLTTLAYCLEACATHGLTFFVLDRPNPINGIAVEGPVMQDSERSFIGYLTVPIRHGMTVGELARLHRKHNNLDVQLEVIPVSGWERKLWFDETGLPWESPSPAMISLNTATLYPGTCLLEATNVSVGRGTNMPFEVIGAPWIDGPALCDDLTMRAIAGVEFEPVEFSPKQREYADQICSGCRFAVIDRDALRSVALGLHVLDAVHRQNPIEFRFDRISRHIGNRKAIEQLQGYVPVPEILEEWNTEVEEFRKTREEFLLYS